MMSTKTEDELIRLRDKYFTCPTRRGFRIFDGYTLPIAYQKYVNLIEDLEVFDDDIWLCSFPKSGTTWAQEMVWCICNNLDFDGAKEDLDTRFVYLELSAFFDVGDNPGQPDILTNSINVIKQMKRPRFIKSHLPWELLPKQIRTFQKRPRIVHVARNPMDTCVSYYYHAKNLGSYTGEFELLTELFLNNKVSYSPYDKNILGYWKRRNETNVLFIKYEDMKNDLSMIVSIVSQFFNVKLSEEDNRSLVHHLSFDNMKKNSSANHAYVIDIMQRKNVSYDKEGTFMRSGKSGEYRSKMSQETINLFKTRFVGRLQEEDLCF